MLGGDNLAALCHLKQAASILREGGWEEPRLKVEQLINEMIKGGQAG